MILFKTKTGVLSLLFSHQWFTIKNFFLPNFIGITHFNFFFLEFARLRTILQDERENWMLTFCFMGFEFEFMYSATVPPIEEEEIPANYN